MKFFIVCTFVFAFITGALIGQVKSLKTQIVSLELDKSELRRNLDTLAGYVKSLDYQLDVVSKAVITK